MRRPLLLLLLTFAAAAHAQLPGTRLTPPALPSQSADSQAGTPVSTGATDSDVVYGNVGHTKLRLDVYRPKSSPEDGKPLRAAVVLIHGGAWIQGDKSLMAAMGRWLARSGYVAFSIDYRLFDGDKHNPWPAQLDDAQRAVRWIRANAPKYGVDPTRIGAFGHSAGAQMAALLGEVETRDNSDAALASYSSRVQAVVEIAGPTEIGQLQDRDGDPFLVGFFGGRLEVKPEAWRSASPLELVGKDTAPFLIFHGTLDKDVPIAQSEQFAAALEKAGVPVTLIKVEDVHTFNLDSSRKKVAFETVAFFNRTLK